jgi:hypothetical protein
LIGVGRYDVLTTGGAIAYTTLDGLLHVLEIAAIARVARRLIAMRLDQCIEASNGVRHSSSPRVLRLITPREPKTNGAQIK